MRLHMEKQLNGENFIMRSWEISETSGEFEPNKVAFWDARAKAHHEGRLIAHDVTTGTVVEEVL